MAALSEHFDSEEFLCQCTDLRCPGKSTPPHPGLIARLEVMRQVVRVPLIVRSGVRCPAHNAAVGGAPDSAHVTAEAADLRCVTSRDRANFLRAAITAGFRRIGIAAQFIHVDVARGYHDQDVIWLYPPRKGQS